VRLACRILSSWSLSLMAGVTAPFVFAGAPPTTPAPHVLDLSGRAVDPLAEAGAGPAVLVFTRTDCPISNRYAPELHRLADRFGKRGVTFWLVYPEGAERAEAIRRHQRDFGYRFAALRDPGHALVRRTGATVTPEVAVFVRDAAGPRMVYRGRIDDRAVELGRTRAAPTRRDLAEVLAALVEGRTVTPRTTPAVGCFISEPE
jgi:hypothetical protein